MNTSKKWLWALIVVVVFVLVWAAWQYGFFGRLLTSQETSLPVSTSSDTTSQINKDLNSVNIDSPDGDLKNLDADLNQL